MPEGSLTPFPDAELEAVSPWERQSGEDLVWYEVFCIYRDHFRPSKRTFDNLIQLLREQGITKSRGQILAASRRYRWEARIAAYEAERARLQALTVKEELEEATRIQADAARQLIGKAMLALGELDPAKLPASEIRQFIVDATKLQRVIAGAPTEVTAAVQEGRDYGAELSAILDAVFEPGADRGGQPAADAGAAQPPAGILGEPAGTQEG